MLSNKDIELEHTIYSPWMIIDTNCILTANESYVGNQTTLLHFSFFTLWPSLVKSLCSHQQGYNLEGWLGFSCYNDLSCFLLCEQKFPTGSTSYLSLLDCASRTILRSASVPSSICKCVLRNWQVVQRHIWEKSPIYHIPRPFSSWALVEVVGSACSAVPLSCWLSLKLLGRLCSSLSVDCFPNTVMREHMICTCGLLGPVVGQYNIDSCLDSHKQHVYCDRSSLIFSGFRNSTVSFHLTERWGVQRLAYGVVFGLFPTLTQFSGKGWFRVGAAFGSVVWALRVTVV